MGLPAHGLGQDSRAQDPGSGAPAMERSQTPGSVTGDRSGDLE